MSELDPRELIFQIAKNDGVVPLNSLPGLWKRKIDDWWTIWINAHKKPLAISDEQHKTGGIEVPPFDCYVEFEGWPCGSFSLATGQCCFSAGPAASFETFCEALKAAAGAVN